MKKTEQLLKNAENDLSQYKFISAIINFYEVYSKDKTNLQAIKGLFFSQIKCNNERQLLAEEIVLNGVGLYADNEYAKSAKIANFYETALNMEIYQSLCQIKTEEAENLKSMIDEYIAYVQSAYEEKKAEVAIDKYLDGDYEIAYHMLKDADYDEKLQDECLDKLHIINRLKNLKENKYIIGLTMLLFSSFFVIKSFDNVPMILKYTIFALAFFLSDEISFYGLVIFPFVMAIGSLIFSSSFENFKMLLGGYWYVFAIITYILINKEKIVATIFYKFNKLRKKDTSSSKERPIIFSDDEEE